MTITEMKKLPKDEFMRLEDATEKIYEDLQKSKAGSIHIWKISPEKGSEHKGWTEAFGEGLSCKMSTCSEWYRTSIIQNINWKEHTFTTLNSTYKFEFIDESMYR